MFLDVTSHPYNILTLKLDNTYYYQDYWHVILFLSFTISKLDATTARKLFLVKGIQNHGPTALNGGFNA